MFLNALCAENGYIGAWTVSENPLTAEEFQELAKKAEWEWEKGDTCRTISFQSELDSHDFTTEEILYFLEEAGKISGKPNKMFTVMAQMLLTLGRELATNAQITPITLK